jgi:molybdopterin synthase sulfur carrier subunit
VSARSIRVLFFAGARDAVGTDAIELTIEAPLTARALLDRLCAEHGRLAPYARSLRIAVNGAYAAWSDEVRAGDEVAVIPPVAGG